MTVPRDFATGTGRAARVLSYSIAELFGEKLRALAERCRPRDLYDVVHLHRRPDLIGRADPVRHALGRKCEHTGIEVPSADTIRSSPFRAEIEEEWENMLGHQLPRPLVPFSAFWSALDEVFRWLEGSSPTTQLPRASVGQVSTLGSTSGDRLMAPEVPSRASSICRRQPPEVEIDYRAAQGRQGPRVVEPYSLRRTADGLLVLFVVNDHGQLRSYRVDHIAGIRPTASTFTPRFRVEF